MDDGKSSFPSENGDYDFLAFLAQDGGVISGAHGQLAALAGENLDVVDYSLGSQSPEWIGVTLKSLISGGR